MLDKYLNDNLLYSWNRINHNGDIKICKDLIDVAKSAGDAVKFQKRDINSVYKKIFWIVLVKALGENPKTPKRRIRI